MWLRRALVVPLTLLLLAAPVRGAEPAPQVTDQCGDATTHGELNGEAMDVEESRAYLDVKSGRVSSLRGADGTLQGFTAAIGLCGDASATEGGYNIGWHYGDECYGNVSWTLAGHHTPGDTGISGQVRSAAGPSVVVTEECYHEQTLPVVDSGVETIYRVTLPDDAISFDGDTVTFTVAKSALPAAAARRLAPGTVWSDLAVVSVDQSASLWAYYADTEGNRGRLQVRTDFALGGASYTVGR